MEDSDNKTIGEAAKRHLAEYRSAETICAGSRDPSSSGLAVTADVPSGGCHGLRLKYPVTI